MSHISNLVYVLLGYVSPLLRRDYERKDMCLEQHYHLLDELIRIGANRAALRSPEQKKLFSAGMYLNQFYTGVEKIVKDYDKKVLEIEKQCEADKCLGVLHVYSELEKLGRMLKALVELRRQVESRWAQTADCTLIDLVVNYVGECVEFYETFQVILHEMHKVFVAQISYWCVRGETIDPFEEFFCSPSLYDTSEMGYPLRNIGLKKRPLFLPDVIAQSIMRIGLCSSLQESEDPEYKEALKTFESEMADIRNKFDAKLLVSKVVALQRRFNKSLHYYMINQRLPKRLLEIKWMFFLARGELFLSFIEDLELIFQRPKLSRKVETEMNSLLHQYERKLYLCSSENSSDEKGKFIFKFTYQQQNSLELDEFSERLKGVGAEDVDELIQQGIEESKRFLLLYQGLKLQLHEIERPLKLFFIPESMVMYNQLFRVLLHMKRIDSRLGTAWSLLKSTSRTKKKSSQMLHILAFHRNLIFFYSQLHCFLHGDVCIDVYEEFITNSIKTEDFTLMILEHNRVLMQMLEKLGFDIEKNCEILKLLANLLIYCDAYCNLIQKCFNPNRRDPNQNRVTLPQFAVAMKSLALLFCETTQAIWTQVANSPDLSPLDFKLTWNDFLKHENGSIWMVKKAQPVVAPDAHEPEPLLEDKREKAERINNNNRTIPSNQVELHLPEPVPIDLSRIYMRSAKQEGL